MEFLDGRFLTTHLFERYSKDPAGWSFALAPGRKHGFFDMLVSSADEAWHIKVDSIYKPSPLMLGAPTELGSAKTNSFNPIPFGYRDLGYGFALELLNSAGGARGSSPYDASAAKLGNFLASAEPVVPERGRSYAEGPFMFKESFKFTQGQKSSDDRLASELHRLMRNKYLSYG
jgi:hypothetical protein